jgi:hypothetical protein
MKGKGEGRVGTQISQALLVSLTVHDKSFPGMKSKQTAGDWNQLQLPK